MAAKAHARATGNESEQMNARIKQLWKDTTPGREMVSIINREFGREFSPFAIYHRANNLGLKVIRARPRPSSSRKSVAEMQRESCLEDPAWEAREEMRDSTACRECFRFYKGGGLYAHVKTQHMHINEYRKIHPGARLFSFQFVARDTGRDCQELMREFATSYATPEERTKAATDREYYDKNEIKKYRICCVERCGLKAADLGHHIRNVHGMSTQDYWVQVGLLPITAVAVLERSREKDAKRNARTLPADLSSKPQTYQKIVPVLIADRAAGGHISNREVCAMFGITVGKQTMNDIRNYCGVPGPIGRPQKSCK